MLNESVSNSVNNEVIPWYSGGIFVPGQGREGEREREREREVLSLT